VGDRLASLPLAGADRAQAGVSAFQLRLRFDRPLEVGGGIAEPARLEADPAEARQNLWIRGPQRLGAPQFLHRERVVLLATIDNPQVVVRRELLGP